VLQCISTEEIKPESSQKASETQEYLALGIIMFHLPLGETPLDFHAVAMMLKSSRQVTDHLVFALNWLLVCSQQLPQRLHVIL